MKKRKPSGAAKSIPAGLGIGLLVSMALTVGLSAAGAYFITTEIVPQGSLGYLSIGILFLSALAGGLSAVGCIKRLKLQMSLLSGGCYFLVLLGISALFFGGQYQGVIATAITVFLGSAAAAGISILNKSKGKFYGKKGAYC